MEVSAYFQSNKVGLKGTSLGFLVGDPRLPVVKEKSPEWGVKAGALSICAFLTSIGSNSCFTCWQSLLLTSVSKGFLPFSG